ncbi:plastocyanin [Candidatus Cyanaurora vandensis]|uniref:plastocyanin n=1 Tax=Candidatus Cyanaurora vandensis TaxID=2714958 RepID=UPI00257BD0C8|nr:plastocyanin [Candidatus Cyanaurora vandensis]
MQRLHFVSAMVIGVLAFAPLVQAKDHIVQMGSTNGRLIYEPKTVTVAKGDTVTWTMGKAGPHNVVFSKAPAGVDVTTISHKKLVNKTDPTFKTTFAEAGDYSYFCTPHKGAGMVGKITVK